ncbi:phospholipid N-methyltransferase PmtA [Legionella oakridgensis]|uniref:Methylase involved in ubiquinone/menaquinone biosynthesis n=2 Tax=Legionella oakridgensis TaxID=29423 RepID=W0BHF9_9GAMM|nr:class I SAM-dependent methyltransferase [Legionella oakridgensis]AHE68072.1 methylase involved in ubiquinone/menaquinone biosynthesis [Legionella oakridgensis ATCC 33761 = DSM 21215]ETO92418.1 phosphatidylethanolamine N-methyltransferase/phosphatidyl-N-methylethanolamine N-methyltransferase [Legionella oakridgensis RV-2-2007]KTD44535.1 phosphatidylethanolamine N-methyltransferase [Legionella oakridgensis]STY21054.1 phosphatidylethanolamine N-methyltransferase [Legionella longbeachae]
MSLTSVRKVYDTYAWFYDFVFGGIFHPGRHFGTDLVNKYADKHAHVLELGVGTGLSLPLYRKDLNITGIDISEKMLNKAKKRVADQKLTTNISLNVMDAGNLTFPDNSFDFVVAMYVASVVPDVTAFLKEVTRVCKPNGEILFINHFASEHPVMRFLEQRFSKIQKIVGFNSNFSIHSILEHKQFKLLETHKINLFGYWKVLRCKLHKNTKPN